MEKDRHSSRFIAAEQIRNQRKYERTKSRPREYIKDRTGIDYIHELAGIENLLSYVRGLSKPVVVDVGGGVTKAAFQLSKSSLGKGLEFYTTGLTPNAATQNFLGKEKKQNTRITSGEMMRGFENESVGCILSVSAIAYSRTPEIYVKRFNEILIPGGVFKGTFRGSNRGYNDSIEEDDNLPEVYDFKKTKELFLQNGFKVEVIEHTNNIIAVMLAIKTEDPNIAKELIRKDSETRQQQAARLKEELKSIK